MIQSDPCGDIADSVEQAIAVSEALLDSHLQGIRRDLKMGNLQYVTVAGIEVGQILGHNFM